MYVPPYFSISDPNEVYSFLLENPFATLVGSADAGELSATHLPLLLSSDKKFLFGHIAKQNQQIQTFQSNAKVLCIFSGPHCYISPTWYESKQAVPTWNYLAVHITGILRIIDDPIQIRNNLNLLVKTFESDTSLYSLDQLDPKYLEGLEKGILSFEIQIEKLEGKQKLSQNHSKERQRLVIDNLHANGGDSEKKIAERMKKILELSP
ncbi:MAG: FMN-binding negative transcriptional regulator [Leptospira sp.]|nr:FMN-binding negative transcriptional regulator [Leptospira sp.]